ncbi:hypothetical protein D9756_002081 [Leucocoprinus leucothites]|uniref:Aminomethyltransferase n=1 Tax=Leucocoprinus leucothites TaxID=201217 RepID=A0A8H5LLZ9_9AGAR|nr:hypothetical protein D9756_002081 [Leucoagaricus leucothites]
MVLLQTTSLLRARCPSALLSVRRLATEAAQLRRTGLYDFHVENGAKMVPFAGYSMPLSYADAGQIASHNHVRSKAGLFDVGHMVQSNFRGKTATEFLEWVTPSSLSSLTPYSSTLSVILNEKGGIIDDTVITKHAADAFYVVTNAGRREKDLAWFKEKLEEWNSGEKGKEGPVEMEVLENWGLLALQGTLMSVVIASAFVPIEGFNLHVARGGYTGEDGFEISIPPSQTVEVAKLLSKAPVQLTGLGARDSLRLEAGMCLYGNDLDEDTTPVEAGLSWVIGKDRKENGTFIGAEGVRKHLKEGPPRRRVGLTVEGAPARQHAKIFDPNTSDILGSVTSGIPSPTLGKNIAMGYVKNGWHKKGTQVEVEVRNKRQKAVLTPMPFVKTNYWRG